MRIGRLFFFILCTNGLAVAEEEATAPVPIEAATNAQKKRAVKEYREGLEHFDAQKFEEALASFESSLAQVDSPNSRLMVARCLAKLERSADAYREFTRVLAEATALSRGLDKYEGTRDAARTELAALKQTVAIVHVVTDGSVTLNGAQIEAPASSELVLPPGPATFVLSLSNGAQVTEQVTLAAGEEREVELVVPAQKAPVSVAPVQPRVEYRDAPNSVSTETLGYVGLGVGGAGVLGFVVFGVLNSQQHGDLQDACPDNQCPASLREDAESGRFYQTAANVSLGVGVVGLMTGAVLLLSGEAVESSTSTSASDTSTELVLGPREVLLRGSF